MNMPEFEKVFFVHYQCDNFEDGNKISSLCVHAYNNTKEFNGDESKAIKDFCDYVSKLSKVKLIPVHWNQDRPHYGPEHIKSRYFELTKKNIKLDYINGINLSFELVNKYGDNYVEHPRLDKLAELNNFSGIRDEKKSAKTFPTERVLLLAKIYLNHHRETLKTSNKTLPVEGELRLEFERYGFFDLPSVKKLSDKGKNQLIAEIASSSISQRIAWLSYLGFLAHLLERHFNNKIGKRNEALATMIKASQDTVKKEINSLAKPKNQNKRYLAYTHLPKVKDAYGKLK